MIEFRSIKAKKDASQKTNYCYDGKYQIPLPTPSPPQTEQNRENLKGRKQVDYYLPASAVQCRKIFESRVNG